MLEYFTKAPFDVGFVLPKGEASSWTISIDNEEWTISNLYIRDSRVKYHWTYMRGTLHNERTYKTHSPVVAIKNYIDGVTVVLCADLSQYIFIDTSTQLLRLYYPISIGDAHDQFALSGKPPVPIEMSEEAYITYLRG